ncbi:hypothetical protein BsWGS_04175 [Bradybaena similaris]
MEGFTFSTADITDALLNRFVVIIGDSNQRCIYKDIVLLLQTDRYLTEKELRTKGERSFMQDELVEGGSMEKMSNGINYREVRQYRTDFHLVRFYFVTRCYNVYVESILKDLQQAPLPDIVIMNSCLWDITRYGIKSIPQYKENLVTLFERFIMCLPPKCLIIWNTTLPISSSAKSGFLVPEVEFRASRLRIDIIEANYYAQKVASRFGFDVLDLHFYLRQNLNMRADDGIHWDKKAHRAISNLILTHIFEAWRISIPRKQVTFASYGSTHARNGYYQQLPRDKENQLTPPHPRLRAKMRQQQPPQPLPQPSQQYAKDRQQQQLQCPQPETVETPFQEWVDEWQPLLPPLLQLQPVLLQPVQMQPVQMQPLQYVDYTADPAVTNNLQFEVGNMAFQNMQVYNPLVWQPYEQSYPIGSEPGHPRTRYQPYKHRRHDPSASSRHRNGH